MPYGQSPWSQVGDAMTGVGQSMSNVVMAQQQGRLRQQQFLAQQAMEQAYYRMAQEREAREAQGQTQRFGMEQQRLDLDKAADQRAAASASRAMEQSQRIGRLQGVRSTPDPMMLVRDPQSAAQLFGDLRSAGVMPQGQADIPADQLQALVAAALRAQATQAMAAQHPQDLVNPVQGGAYPMLDPITMQQLAPGFVSPYQQRMGDLRDREVGIHGQDEARKAAADAATQQFRNRKLQQDLYLGQGRVLAPIAAGVQNRSAVGEPKNVDVGAANDVFQQLGRAIFDKAPSQSQAQGQVKQPKSQAEYDALQPGDVYIDTDGQTKRKK